MTVERVEVKPLKRVYPHVDQIEDWRAQQTVRLLWDRVFDLEARLQAAEASLDRLVTESNVHEEEIHTARVDAREALATALEVLPVGGAPAPPGVPTIPNYYDSVVATLATFASPIIPIADVEDGKAQLTRAAAWAIYQGTYQPADTHIGLLAKTYGANVNGRSTDIVVQMTDGSYADIASATDNGDGTVTITAQWGPAVGDSNTTDESRWIVPTALIAAEPGPM